MRRAEHYKDSEHKYFCGDIIITDPCYIIKDEDWDRVYMALLDTDDDFFHIAELPTAIIRNTIYGDWSCTTYKITEKTRREIGKFCADAGLVAVCHLDEALEYNPDFDYHLARPWTTTIIRDFDGDVWFRVVDDKNVEVRGKGINTKTGKVFEFCTKQTGL